MTDYSPEPETPRQRLDRLIAARVNVLHGTWKFSAPKARRLAVYEIVVDEMADLEGAGMATAGPRMIAIVELLLAERP